MQRNLNRIISNLIDNACMDVVLASVRKREPGYFIKQLDEKDRNALKEAKSSDFQGRIEKDKLPIP